MSIPDESIYIVSMRVRDWPKPSVPGSATNTCGACGDEVWVSPATAKSLPGVPVLCVPCFQSQVKTLPAGEKAEIYITAKSLREVAQTLINRRRRN